MCAISCWRGTAEQNLQLLRIDKIGYQASAE